MARPIVMSIHDCWPGNLIHEPGMSKESLPLLHKIGMSTEKVDWWNDELTPRDVWLDKEMTSTYTQIYPADKEDD